MTNNKKQVADFLFLELALTLRIALPQGVHTVFPDYLQLAVGDHLHSYLREQ
jgi:hypothetical protein